MNTAIVDIVHIGIDKAADVASTNPYYAGGMAAAGVVVGIVTAIWMWRKNRRAVPK